MGLQNSNVSSIQKALDLIIWEKRFCNKNIDTQVSIFSETILDIFSNFVLNKIIRCNDKDPIWMIDQIKSKVKFKNQ